jgi:hypothetical protein
VSLPAQFTDEQREQLLRATTGLTAAVQAYATALLPAIQAAAEQFRQLSAALQAAGYLDEDGRPLHQGGNAEDCPAFEERTTRPAHPDGTPYRYVDIVDEGWEHCDCCGRWGRSWTPERPHVCPNEPKVAAS